MTETLERTALFEAARALPISDKLDLLDQLQDWVDAETAPSPAELTLARGRLAAYRAHPEDTIDGPEFMAQLKARIS
jgi:hypothetical protein